MIKSVEELDIYNSAYRLALEIHKASLSFPKHEQYALADQMRRASRGICANIAEGFAKSFSSNAEFRRYLLMAIGSAEEMKVWTSFCFDLSYIEQEQSERWKKEYVVICKQINRLISTLK